MKNTKHLNNATLNEIRAELDSSLGGINANIQVLKALQTETGRIENKVVNMDMSNFTSMGLTMNDLTHQLIIINNLLFHTLEELKGNYKNADHLKQELYEYDVIEKEKAFNP